MASKTNYRFLVDPVQFCRAVWPHENMYDKQREFLYSLRDDDESVVPAANMMGKDFALARAVIWFFVTRPWYHFKLPKHGPCRIVTSSAKDEHLIVLWGEMKNAVRTSKYPMLVDQGGPLLMNHREIFWIDPQTQERCELSYIKGMVSSDESMASLGGHHIPNVGDGVPRTMWACDESSSAKDEYKKMTSPWANRMAIIGNTYDCNNFFKRAVDGDREHNIPGGNLVRPYVKEDQARYIEEYRREEDAVKKRGGTMYRPFYPDEPKGCYRRVIHIPATASPNIKYAKLQLERGEVPDDTIVVPGVKSWGEYQKNLATWNPIEQSVKLDAKFYKGAGVRMFPEERLLLAKEMAAVADGLTKSGKLKRIAKGMGVDPAEGGDKTAIAVVDELGLIDLVYEKTPDTSVIKGSIIAMMKQYNVDPERVTIDTGGGGKQIADELRARGYDIRVVSFGAGIAKPLRMGVQVFDERVEEREERYTYKNMRAKMYGRLMEMLDPKSDWAQDRGGRTFALPAKYSILFDELEPIPLSYDREGVLYLLPKNKPKKDSKEPTLTELIGHSPDLADATVLAIEAMEHEDGVFTAGGL